MCVVCVCVQPTQVDKQEWDQWDQDGAREGGEELEGEDDTWDLDGDGLEDTPEQVSTACSTSMPLTSMPPLVT